MKFIVQFQILASYIDRSSEEVLVAPGLGREGEIYATYHKVFSSTALPQKGHTINVYTWGGWGDYPVIDVRFEPRSDNDRILLPIVILETEFLYKPIEHDEDEDAWFKRCSREFSEQPSESGLLEQGYKLIRSPHHCAAGNLRNGMDDWELPHLETKLD